MAHMSIENIGGSPRPRTQAGLESALRRSDIEEGVTTLATDLESKKATIAGLYAKLEQGRANKKMLDKGEKGLIQAADAAEEGTLLEIVRLEQEVREMSEKLSSTQRSLQ